MRNLKLMTAVLAMVSGPVLAEPPAVPAPAPVSRAPLPAHTSETADQIAQINERMAVLNAQLGELEVKTKIAGKHAEISRLSNSGQDTSSLDALYLPSVMEISSVDGKRKAVLNTPGGNTQTVRVGDRVGAWKVVSITADDVTVQRGKKKVPLGYGSYAPVASAPQVGTTSVGAPQMPGQF